MAAKPSKSPKKSPERKFNGFVQCDLTKEQKEHAKSWIESSQPDWNTLFKLVDDEYKVSFGYDNYHKTFQCSLTCVANQSVNNGWVLVARAPDCMLAFGMACYKHFIVLDQIWTDGGEGRQEDEGWG